MHAPGFSFVRCVGWSEQDGSAKEIKKAYRDLAKMYHPDKCKGMVKVTYSEEEIDCVTAMNRVNLANEVLGDEDKRILYDAGGMDLVKQGVGDENGGQQQGMDPFAALFGGGGRQQTHSNKGPDAAVSHTVELADIYNGNDLQMNINRRVVCRGCAGDKGKGKAKCAQCGKCPDEVKMVQRQMGPGMIVQQEERVPSKEKCKVEDTELSTVLERGIKDGAEVRFPRKSEQSPGQVCSPFDSTFSHTLQMIILARSSLVGSKRSHVADLQVVSLVIALLFPSILSMFRFIFCRLSGTWRRSHDPQDEKAPHL